MKGIIMNRTLSIILVLAVAIAILTKDVTPILAAEFENIDTFDTHPLRRWIYDANNTVNSEFTMGNSLMNSTTEGINYENNSYYRALGRSDFKTEMRLSVPNITNEGLVTSNHSFEYADEDTIAELESNYNWFNSSQSPKDWFVDPERPKYGINSIKMNGTGTGRDCYLINRTVYNGSIEGWWQYDNFGQGWMWLRSASWSEGYMFRVDKGGSVKIYQDTDLQLGSASIDAFSADTYYHLRFTVTGDQLRGYVNGELVVSAGSDTYTSGFSGIGFYSAGHEQYWDMVQAIEFNTTEPNRFYVSIEEESEIASDRNCSLGVMFESLNNSQTTVDAYYCYLGIDGISYSEFIRNYTIGEYITIEWKMNALTSQWNSEIKFENGTSDEASELEWFEIDTTLPYAFSFSSPIIAWGNIFNRKGRIETSLDYIKAPYRENRFIRDDTISQNLDLLNISSPFTFVFEEFDDDTITIETQYDLSISYLDCVSFKMNAILDKDNDTDAAIQTYLWVRLYEVNSTTGSLKESMRVQTGHYLENIPTSDYYAITRALIDTEVVYNKYIENNDLESNGLVQLGVTFTYVDNELALHLESSHQDEAYPLFFSITRDYPVKEHVLRIWYKLVISGGATSAELTNGSLTVESFKFITQDWFDIMPDIAGGFVEGLGNIFAVAFKMLADSFSLIMLPITLILDAILSVLGEISSILAAVLVALGILETLLTVIDSVLDSISSTLSTISGTLSSISSTVSTISTGVSNILTQITSVATDISSLLTDTAQMVTDLGSIVSGISDLYDEVIGDISTFLGDIPNILSVLNNLAVSIWTAIISELSNIVDELLDLLALAVDELGQIFIDIILWSFDSVITPFSVAIAPLTSGFWNITFIVLDWGLTAYDGALTFSVILFGCVTIYLFILPALEDGFYLNIVISRIIYDIAGGRFSLLGFSTPIPFGFLYFIWLAFYGAVWFV
jgi:methyl-accepting chemotaxis protein